MLRLHSPQTTTILTRLILNPVTSLPRELRDVFGYPAFVVAVFVNIIVCLHLISNLLKTTLSRWQKRRVPLYYFPNYNCNVILLSVHFLVLRLQFFLYWNRLVTNFILAVFVLTVFGFRRVNTPRNKFEYYVRFIYLKRDKQRFSYFTSHSYHYNAFSKYSKILCMLLIRALRTNVFYNVQDTCHLQGVCD